MPVLFSIIFALLLTTCTKSPEDRLSDPDKTVSESSNPASLSISNDIVVGAERLDQYLSLIQDKNIGLLINHSSYIGKQHLIDHLLSNGILISKIFVPEHGYRGKADAGEIINDTKDPVTGIPIVSLYGKNKKPSAESMKDIDIVIYDIQDVGIRFYTYISTMHYMMESCAESDIPMLVLDRPNPNGHYIDGPIIEKEFKSFVGMHSIPIVYGMTPGELAQMINGEAWLENDLNCDLTVVPCANYNHQMHYSLPIKPSPNLPNDRSVELYPSLCFFEATIISVGRGTTLPFQIICTPYAIENYDTIFVPTSTQGAKYPKHENKNCYGFVLNKPHPFFKEQKGKINLSFIINMMNLNVGDEFIDRPEFFDKLAGTDNLRLQLLDGMSESEIRNTWSEGLEEFKNKRKKYLLYD